jgi:hypothetical protein
MRLRLAGAVKRLNIEHRTSNIEHRILMTLRFIYLKKANRRILNRILQRAPLDVLGA